MNTDDRKLEITNDVRYQSNEFITYKLSSSHKQSRHY